MLDSRNQSNHNPMKKNIIFSLTYNIAFTVETVINSILRNSTKPDELAFHLIVPQSETEQFQQKLASSFPDPKITITINTGEISFFRHGALFIESRLPLHELRSLFS